MIRHRLSYIRTSGLNAVVLAVCVALAPIAGDTQVIDQGGTLGIDCERPRYTAEGKLILGDDGNHRVKCEVDRATALNYALVVSATRDGLRNALNTVPQPLWDHLVTYLHDTEVQNAITDWSYPTDESSDINTLNGTEVNGRARYWATGILDKTPVLGVWHDKIQARACGVTLNPDTGRPELANGSTVLVWLGRHNIRDRWTPEMVQRTVRSHLESTEGRFSISEHIPDVLTDARELVDAKGRTRNYSSNLRACLDREPRIPNDSLVMRASLTHSTDRGDKSYPCSGTHKVGSQLLRWEKHNGIYIVPMRAIRADGSDHPQRGKPLLTQFSDPQDRPVLKTGSPALDASDYPLILPEKSTFLVKTCREPRARNLTRTESCPTTINGNPVNGSFIRTFRFREFQDDPSDPNRVYLKPVMRDPGNSENPLGVPVTGSEHPLWSQATVFCPDVPDLDLPRIPDPVVDIVPATTCKQQWGDTFEGTRTGYVQTITYPDDWPVDEVVIRTVDDDCFSTIPVQGNQTTTESCPSGYTGTVTKSRNLIWLNRAWAVQDDVYPNFGRRLPNPAEFHHAVAQVDTDQNGLAWYDRVATEGWNTTDNCSQESDSDSGEGEGSYDTDGDGITDSRSPGDNGGGYSTGGIGSQSDQSGDRGGDDEDDND